MDLYRATPAETWTFFMLPIQSLHRLLRQARGSKDPVYTRFLRSHCRRMQCSTLSLYVMSLCWRYPSRSYWWLSMKITTIGTTPKVWMMHVHEIFGYLRRMGQSWLEIPHAVRCFSPRNEICMIFRDFIIKFIH